MKHKIKQIRFSLFIALVGMLILSCEDHRMNKMVDDQIYFLESGFVQRNVLSLEKSTLELYVVKSGIGQLATDVTIEISEDILSDYNAENNTFYKMLPAEYYSLESNSLSFAEDGYKGFFLFDLDNSGISALQADSDDIWVIPCRLVVANPLVEIPDPEQGVLLISPIIIEPYVEFLKSLDSLNYPFASERLSYDIELYKTYGWAENISIEVDLDETLIDEYNAENNTALELLPPAVLSNVTLPITATMSGNATNISYRFNLDRDGFQEENGDYIFGEFALPLRITNVSANKINERKSVFMLKVLFSPKILNPLERWATHNLGELNTFAPGDARTALGNFYQYGRNVALPAAGSIPVVRGIETPTDSRAWTETNAILFQVGTGNSSANWYSDVRTDLDTWRKVVAETGLAPGAPTSYIGNNGGDPCPPGYRVPKVGESYTLVFGQTVNFVTLTTRLDVNENNIDILGDGQTANYVADYHRIDASTAVALRFKNTVYSSAYLYKLVGYPTAGSAHIEVRAKVVQNSVTLNDIQTWTESDWSDAEVRHIPLSGYRLHAGDGGTTQSPANAGRETYFWVDLATTHLQAISSGFVGWSAASHEFGSGYTRFKNTAIPVRCIKEGT